MSSLRILLLGGLTSYRALFSWLRPWIAVPVLVLQPLFQVLLFVYVGRAANVGNDTFFLIGNAILNSAIPCLFAMGQTIQGERQQGTLSLLLASPSRRIPLFLGRALPAIANGFVVTVVCFVFGAVVLHVSFPASTWGPLALAMAVCSFSCTGLGMLMAAIAMRVRSVALLANVIFGLLMLLAGVNVPVDSLPHWARVIAEGLPLTHGITAARELAAGGRLGDLDRQLGIELLLAVVYTALGVAILLWLEWESRRSATLENR